MERRFSALGTVIALAMLCALPALAVSEAEVESAVASQGKEAVAGNFIVWFLCAIAFLKVSTKLDSFIQALGLGVGRPQGSLLTEALMALRGFDVAKAFGGGGNFGHGHRGFGEDVPLLQGGLAGAVERKMESDTAAVLGGISDGGVSASIGSKMYDSSLGQDGGFASRVIGSVATGQNPGVITSNNAVEAMSGYFEDTGSSEIPPAADDVTNEPVPAVPLAFDGGTAIPVSPDSGVDSISSSTEEPPTIPTSQSIQQHALNRMAMGQMGNLTAEVEMGNGKITGKEIIPGRGTIDFAMYHAKSYEKPSGHFTTQTSRDGEQWYKVYAEPGIKKTPTQPDEKGRMQYREQKIAVMPREPKRRK